MGIPKSQVAQLCTLFCHLIADVYQQIPHLSNRECELDQKTVTARVNAEGISFLTKTLPKLGKAIDRSLETGLFLCPRELKRFKGCAIPSLLRYVLLEFFDWNGKLRSHTSVEVLADLRTLCFFFYKADMPYAARQEKAVVERFVENETLLAGLSFAPGDPILETASRIAEKVFYTCDFRSIVPSHGPGAVAGGQSQHEKYIPRTKYRKLHEVFPYYEFFFNRGPDLLSRLQQYKDMVCSDTPTARVVLVPKDSRGPRLISCEPVEIQYIQQGVKDVVYHHLENHPDTRGIVNFRNQEVNRKLALEASLDASYATLDLKDASDLVHNDLVEAIFSRLPEHLKVLQACRSTHTELPDGTILPLRKYAPMGSALCFPVEAFTFYCLLRARLELNDDYRRGDFYVYGDDIIIRTNKLYAADVLEDFGLVINEDKSFSQGQFRESCGLDAFDGTEVTPLRYRKSICDTADRIGAVIAGVSLGNRLYSRRYTRAAAYVREIVESNLRSTLPWTNDASSSYLAWYEPIFKLPYSHTGVKWNKNLHRFEKKVWTVQPKKVTCNLFGSERRALELIRKITVGWSDEFRAYEYTVRRAVTLKRRWKPA